MSLPDHMSLITDVPTKKMELGEVCFDFEKHATRLSCVMSRDLIDEDERQRISNGIGIVFEGEKKDNALEEIEYFEALVLSYNICLDDLATIATKFNKLCREVEWLNTRLMEKKFHLRACLCGEGIGDTLKKRSAEISALGLEYELDDMDSREFDRKEGLTCKGYLKTCRNASCVENFMTLLHDISMKRKARDEQFAQYEKKIIVLGSNQKEIEDKEDLYKFLKALIARQEFYQNRTVQVVTSE